MDSAIIGLMAAVIVALLGQSAAIWYKLGRLEGTVTGLQEAIRDLGARMSRVETKLDGLEERLDRANVPR